MRFVTKRLGLVCLVLGLGYAVFESTTGCSKDEHPSDVDGGGGGGTKGDPCKATTECALGYVCAGDGTCQRAGEPGTQNEGEGCSFNTDCVIDLVCSSMGKCVKPGKGAEGDICTGNELCQKGLLCSAAGKCAKPGDPGTKGPKEACEAAADCAYGLVCLDKVCTTLPYWAGVNCAEDPGALRALFEIPRAGKTVEEFYRLPFPNDIRLKNGKVDLSGHPNPGTAIPSEYGDVVGEFFKAIQADVTGFGTTTAVFFRISDTFDVQSFGPKFIEFLNIDKSSPGYGKGVAYAMWATTGRGKYICSNHIAIRPAVGQPLRPKTTYAVMLKKGLTDETGKAVAVDKDFKVVLGNTAPSDADEKAAWNAYQPLRDYLGDKGLNPDDYLTAAVFTTMDPRARMARFREVVHGQADAPEVKDLTLCDGKQKSPCDDGSDPTHVCGASPSSDFHELQGTYPTPVFQQGTAPYKAVADGGAIAYESDGKPKIQRHEEACFALTVPKATMPTEGWPVVIFAHGTGGSYRSFINNETAKRLALIKDGTTTLGSMAVISIDGSMHGPRSNAGDSDSPDELFFNLRNPRAARDNVYQGAADKYQLLRLVQQLDLDAATSPTGEALKFDLSRIYFFGHSQGTIEGIPFAAFEPEVKGLVLSGAGGYLLGSLLGKTKPVNVAGLVRLALADNNVSTSHPLLNLLQLFFEEVDAVNYGQALFSVPEQTVGAKHTFLGFGVADSFTPPGTINALGWSMNIRQVRQSAERCKDGICNGTESCKTCADDCGKCPDGATCGNGSCEAGESCAICQEDCKPCPDQYAFDDPPVTGNVSKAGGVKFTAGMVQYVSDGSYDDHFVVFQNPDGVKQSTVFLGTAVKDGVPTIVKVK